MREFPEHNASATNVNFPAQLMLSRRQFLVATALSGIAWTFFPAHSLADSSEDYLAELTRGNVRFASGKSKHPHEDLNRLHETGLHGQHPRAAVLACADSRVSPEILFDQGIGDLFTVRVAGNVANGDEIGSVEYAVEHLHVPLCVVLGHTHCGAVKAVVEGEHVTHSIEHLVAHVGASFHSVQKSHPALHGEPLIQAVVEENVRESIRSLTSGSEILNERSHNGQLRIVGAIYDIETGQVHWLS